VKGGQRPIFASGGVRLVKKKMYCPFISKHNNLISIFLFGSIFPPPPFPFYFWPYMQIFNSSAFAAPSKNPPIVGHGHLERTAEKVMLYFIPLYT
jgi:hypothetical protein